MPTQATTVHELKELYRLQFAKTISGSIELKKLIMLWYSTLENR